MFLFEIASTLTIRIRYALVYARWTEETSFARSSVREMKSAQYCADIISISAKSLMRSWKFMNSKDFCLKNCVLYVICTDCVEL